jgi:hypothetical protein
MKGTVVMVVHTLARVEVRGLRYMVTRSSIRRGEQAGVRHMAPSTETLTIKRVVAGEVGRGLPPFQRLMRL